MKNSQDKLYNLINLEEISGGSDDFIREMIKLFVTQAKSTIDGLNNAFDQKDLNEIKNLAHQIKPSIDNLRIDVLSPVIREVERLAEDGGAWEKLSPMIMETNTVLEAVLSQLDEELKNRTA
ncbi:HPt (histidine-containing phosphotransfer) domain-containing protein [Cyclobacterium xiamenense]|jgi:HPt (histidine-containing phosphotransfer) domain-containing protein|uniref:HPt (Histidine-containing phosphotransfer) domain-containing protein n=1 Tax=Cyclobacterium xiamenense TaxID=1297121 RepID=A0A1H6ZLV5_9BACT|nr:Hpt domain-containing protein [Cyclobacterium xiamenense]SEJ49795.1 HPt (histidine-containing phosphotransfer) domain-containing protein [Cyclobacterium xiamenense]